MQIYQHRTERQATIMSVICNLYRNITDKNNFRIPLLKCHQNKVRRRYSLHIGNPLAVEIIVLCCYAVFVVGKRLWLEVYYDNIALFIWIPAEYSLWLICWKARAELVILLRRYSLAVSEVWCGFKNFKVLYSTLLPFCVSHCFWIFII